MAEKKALSVRLSNEDREDLKMICEREGRTEQWFLAQSAKEKISRMKRQIIAEERCLNALMIYLDNGEVISSEDDDIRVDALMNKLGIEV
jgi:ribosome assembly protein YihI (activator of Der GTPase)